MPGVDVNFQLDGDGAWLVLGPHVRHRAEPGLLLVCDGIPIWLPESRFRQVAFVAGDALVVRDQQEGVLGSWDLSQGRVIVIPIRAEGDFLVADHGLRSVMVRRVDRDAYYWQGEPMRGLCGHCGIDVDSTDPNHRVTSIVRGGRGVECVLRGDIAAEEGGPLR